MGFSRQHRKDRGVQRVKGIEKQCKGPEAKRVGESACFTSPLIFLFLCMEWWGHSMDGKFGNGMESVGVLGIKS